jgi:hypothetical protein
VRHTKYNITENRIGHQRLSSTTYRVEVVAQDADEELPLLYPDMEAAICRAQALLARYCDTDSEALVRITENANESVFSWSCAGWLAYQYVIGRIMGRAGFAQSIFWVGSLSAQKGCNL